MEAIQEHHNVWEKLIQPQGEVEKLLRFYESEFNNLPGLNIRAQVLVQYTNIETIFLFQIMRANDTDSMENLFVIGLNSDLETKGTFITTIISSDPDKKIKDIMFSFDNINQLDNIIKTNIETNILWRNKINSLLVVR